MTVGTLCVRLMIRDARSLKDKRRIIKSLKDRLRNKFNVAVAEVDDHDIWQRAMIGIVTISNNGRFVNSTLSHIVNFIQTIGPISLIDYGQEML